MHQLREVALCGLAGALSLVATFGLGCSRESRDAVTKSEVLSDGQMTGEIVLASEASVIEASPNVLHEVQLEIKNVGKRNLTGVSPRLPCRCNIVEPLPDVFPSGSTNTVTLRVLTPFAGSLIKEIEFFDDAEIRVGSVQVAFQILGDVPRLAHAVKPVWFRHVAGAASSFLVEFETVERLGAPDFITELSVMNGSGVSIEKPICLTVANIDREVVLRKYRFPVKVDADEDVNVGLRVRFSNDESGDTFPMKVEVLPRAHLIPRQLVINTSDIEAGKFREATFRLVSRISGDVYRIESFDRDLLSICEEDSADRQNWTVKIVRPDVTDVTTTVTLVSNSGDRKDLLVSIK